MLYRRKSARQRSKTRDKGRSLTKKLHLRESQHSPCFVSMKNLSDDPTWKLPEK